MDADPVQSFITLQLLPIVILTLTSTYFVASETAIVSVNKNRIHRKVEERNRKAMLVERLLQEPTSFLSTIQVAITLADFFNSASAATSISIRLSTVLEAWAVPYGETISVMTITILLSFVALVFGELVPRRIVLQDAEIYSMFYAKPILIVSKIVSPLTRISSWSIRFVFRLLDMRGEDVEEPLSREEVRSMVESRQESDVSDEDGANVIDSILTFDDTLAEEVMTPRPDVFRIDIDDPRSEYLDELMEVRHSRIPVYRDSIDNTIDILNIKDFVVEAKKSGFEHMDISRVPRKPFFVLEGRNVDDLFRGIQNKHQHIAILIDEYGGFSGIVTMEDLAEEIMGDTRDEYDEDDEAQIEKLDEHTYVLDDGIPVDDIGEELGLQLENGNHETIPRFLLSLIGQIPEDGEEREVIWNHIEFQVEEIKYKRIHEV